eukprot:7385762-Prymnesium_polylepis.2
MRQHAGHLVESQRATAVFVKECEGGAKGLLAGVEGADLLLVVVVRLFGHRRVAASAQCTVHNSRQLFVKHASLTPPSQPERHRAETERARAMPSPDTATRQSGSESPQEPQSTTTTSPKLTAFLPQQPACDHQQAQPASCSGSSSSGKRRVSVMQPVACLVKHGTQALHSNVPDRQAARLGLSKERLEQLTATLNVDVLQHTLRTQRLLHREAKWNQNPVRKQCHLLLDEPRTSRAAACIFFVICVSILVSVINWQLSTTLKVRNNPEARSVTDGVEIACTIIFIFEASMRIFIASIDFYNLIDFYLLMDIFSILPNLIDWFAGTDSLPTVLQDIASLLKMCRILKLMRHYTDWRVLGLALKHALRPICIPGFAMILTILLLSGALWVAEGEVSTRARER